ncbi:hypothetical protein CMI47_16520 [Candidatus Pacearchaeota archaeon]|jgi:hypothetical protein|nr:hypothetical protein [Candidatus Pacearchaeota archaeon]|tara:strand:- start:10660 stop:10845 length:186 start_codon:yes stop_codon:yes gene_type:complete
MKVKGKKVTKWLPKRDEGFCLMLKHMIQKNQGDYSWLERNDKGQIALFRTTNGLRHDYIDV